MFNSSDHHPKAESRVGPSQDQVLPPAWEHLAPVVSRPPEEPLPRAKRRPRRAKADRGLPSDAELGRLATEYLLRQRKLWPELVKAEFLPEPSEKILSEMVEDFKARHRGTCVGESG